MTQEVKNRLDPQSYEKLRDLIKIKTSFENITKENIEVTKEAINLLFSWLESIYQLDRKEVVLDEDGEDIEKLFKTTKR